MLTYKITTVDMTSYGAGSWSVLYVPGVKTFPAKLGSLLFAFDSTANMLCFTQNLKFHRLRFWECETPEDYIRVDKLCGDGDGGYEQFWYGSTETHNLTTICDRLQYMPSDQNMPAPPGTIAVRWIKLMHELFLSAGTWTYLPPPAQNQ